MAVKTVAIVAGIGLALAGPALAEKQAPPAPVDLVPPALQTPPQSTAPSAPTTPAPTVIAPLPAQPAPAWSIGNASALLVFIQGVGTRGLSPADYGPEELQAAIKAGEGTALNDIATTAFTKLLIDLRDGRTPYSARVQWFIKDPDATNFPTDALLRQALDGHDFEAVFSSVEPTHPDYAALKAALATAKDPTRQQIIKANMDRWRWLPRDLGTRYVYVNVPEYMVRVVGKGKNIASYRAIVGAPKTATPQLSETAVGMIIHPTWTIPQSIIKESVGALIANNPGAARARGYTWTGSGKNLSVVQKFGPGNSLGMMKMDMPNPHAIFLHDTPSKQLFERPVRALSHGCIRTDRAVEFAILMSILQADFDPHEAANLFKRGLNDRIPFTDPVQVFINYFTMASNGDGKLNSFADIYGRDAPVIASFAQPRQEKVATTPAVIVPIEAPGA
jgi:murein L,D-transpeptidase YcbB/YkuD